MDNREYIELFYSRSYEEDVNKKILDDKNYIVPRQQLYNYVKNLINIPYADFISYLEKKQHNKNIEDSAITQFSSFSSCEIDMCNALLWANNPGLQFLEIGKLFPEKVSSKTHAAYRKFGENQIKTAAQLGLTFEYYDHWFLSCLGYLYPTLNQEEKESLLARTITRNIFYSHLLIDVIHHNIIIADYLKNLSETTQKRRVGNVLTMIQFCINECIRSGFIVFRAVRNKSDLNSTAIKKISFKAKKSLFVIEENEDIQDRIPVTSNTFKDKQIQVPAVNTTNSETSSLHVLLFRKRIDKSFRSCGFTLSKSSYHLLPLIVGHDIKKGSSQEVTVSIDNKLFDARLNHIKFTNTQKDCYQIFWKKNSGILQYLKEYLARKIYTEIDIYGIIGKSTILIQPVTSNIREGQLNNLAETNKKRSSYTNKQYETFEESHQLAAESVFENNNETEAVGIWSAFKNEGVRVRYKNKLIERGYSKETLVSQFAVFRTIIETADDDENFGLRLNECNSFEECKNILLDLIDSWQGISQWLSNNKDFFWGYLDFLKERFQRFGSFLYESNRLNEKKTSRSKYNLQNNSLPVKKESYHDSTEIELTDRWGKKQVFSPIRALIKVVNLVGPRFVFLLGLKCGESNLVYSSQPHDLKTFTKIKNGYWLNISGTTQERYINIKEIIKYSSSIIDAKLVSRK